MAYYCLSLIFLVISSHLFHPLPQTATSEVEFAILSYQIEMDCTRQLLFIRWQSVYEENVANYKIHRLSLDQQQPNGWVNLFALGAQGAGSDYTVIDAAVTPKRSYHYRIYAFDTTGFLSRAFHTRLDPTTIPSCLYLPVVVR